MRNLFGTLTLVVVVAFAATASPRPAPMSVTGFRADSTVYKDYVGNYAMKDAPFQTIVVTVENGKLMGEAVDQGKGELVPDEKTADQFSVPNYDAVVVFGRNADKKITKLLLTVQGQTFEGEKLP